MFRVRNVSRDLMCHTDCRQSVANTAKNTFFIEKGPDQFLIRPAKQQKQTSHFASDNHTIKRSRNVSSTFAPLKRRLPSENTSASIPGAQRVRDTGVTCTFGEAFGILG